jgi:hypothetical protein
MLRGLLNEVNEVIGVEMWVGGQLSVFVSKVRF